MTSKGSQPHFHPSLAVKVKDFCELITLLNVFEGAGIIFGGEEIITVFEHDAFADVFEGVGIRPADADGFFGEDDGFLMTLVDRPFGEDPVDLVFHEMFGEASVGFDGGFGEKKHRRWLVDGFRVEC